MDEDLKNFREKRKWQIALRRYVIEKQLSSAYAPYFGLDIENFRNWIEVQFDQDLSWENFGKDWQFDHIVPVVYFDFSDEHDLRLCWNFMNIRVEKNQSNKARSNRIDVITAKSYFLDIYNTTGHSLAYEMVKKIETIELSQITSTVKIEQFILSKLPYLNAIRGFGADEYKRLNTGSTLSEIQFEQEMLSRFGK